MNEPARKRFNPWMWMPVLVIVIAAIPNVVLIVMARKAHISKVEEQPWLAAARIDDQARARSAFDASGTRWVVEVAGDRLLCRMEGAAIPGPLSISCYRASDAALDRSLPWPDPGQPVETALPATGRWVVKLVDAQRLVLATRSIQLDPVP